MDVKIKTIGIIGGGQLGRMLVEAAHKLGFAVTVLEKSIDCPAYSVLDLQKDKFIAGDLSDYDKLLELANSCDVMTFEIEHIDTKALQKLESDTGKTIYPSPKVLEIINDKFSQKTFLKIARLPVGDFEPIVDLTNTDNLTQRFGFPFLVKSRKGGYDGGGNFVVRTKAELDQLIINLDLKLQHQNYFVEKFVAFEREISVLLARSQTGQVEIYPVIDTFQENNICSKTVAPSSLSSRIKDQTKKIALEIANQFDYVGVMAVEMFVLDSEEILINEIAPRVHNSGHWTLDGSITSQFEQHIRCVTGMDLGSISNKSEYTIMFNVLGKDYDLTQNPKTTSDQNVRIYDYNKKEIRPNRKMGHINIVGESIAEVELTLSQLLKS